MARRAGSGKTPRQAPDAASPGSGLDRQAKTPGLALPADLGRSLRLLDDARLDRLAEAVADEVRRRGRDTPDRPTEAGRSPKRPSAKAAGARSDAAAVTYSSWINLVERFFASLTEHQLRRGSHRSVVALERAIRGYLEIHNEQPTPFRWTKSADQIIESVNSALQIINQTEQ